MSGSAFYGSQQFAFLGIYYPWGYIPTYTLVQLIKELITSLATIVSLARSLHFNSFSSTHPRTLLIYQNVPEIY